MIEYFGGGFVLWNYLCRVYKQYWFLALAIRGTLDYIYYCIGIPVLGQGIFHGYFDNSTGESVILSWVILLLSLPLLKVLMLRKKDDITDVVVVMLYYVSFIPFTTCVGAGIVDSAFAILNGLYWFVLLSVQIFMKELRWYGFLIKVREKINPIYLSSAMWIACSLIILGVSWYYTDFRIGFHLLTDLFSSEIYEIRALAPELPSIVPYIFQWAISIVTCLMAVELHERRLYLFFYGVFLILLAFGFNAMKSVLFFPLLVVGGVLLFRGQGIVEIKMLVLQFGLMGLFVAVIEFLVYDGKFIVDMFFNRLMILPNRIHYMYYQFFVGHECDYFRSSFLRWFGAVSPYVNGISLEIGSEYVDDGCWANSGLFSDAYAELGILGIFLMPLLFVFILKMYNLAMTGHVKGIAISLAAYYTYTFLNVSLTTACLTNGFFIVCLFFSALKPSYKKFSL